MKFAHLADCHIGAWRDPKLKELPIQAFEKVIEKCIVGGVDFVLISGDLFNTSHPGIDILKLVVSSLKKLLSFSKTFGFIFGNSLALFFE